MGTKFVTGPLNGYYLGFFANYGTDVGTNISVILITSETHQVSYSIEVPSMGYFQNGTLSAGDEVILDLSSSVEVSSSQDQYKGIYLTTSSQNVTVIGQSLKVRTSDSFFALPIIQLSDIYVYYGISVPRASIHDEAISSSILIVGTENNTIVRLTVTQFVTISVGNNILTIFPGRQRSFVINRLQTVFIGSTEDMSGTKIVSDNPVSVFSGHRCANVPSNVTACSYLIEQIPPTILWGRVYFTAPLVNKISYTIKILAAYDSTAVTMYCNDMIESHNINEGKFVSKILMNEYCAIYSNKEVLVVQLSHGGSEDLNDYGDPMMTLVPATSQYLNKLHFATVRNLSDSGYNHYINIIVTEQYYQPHMIYLVAGGVTRSLVTEQWVPIQVNNFAEAYVTQVTIPEGIAQVMHTNEAAQMTATVYGFHRHDGYGHIGGIRSYAERVQISTPAG